MTTQSATIQTIEVFASDYNPENKSNHVSPLISSCGGFVQYVTDTDGRLLARIWYNA